MKHFVSVAGLIGAILASGVSAQDTYFYAIQESDDRLWRMETDGTTTPIGDESGIGFPEVRLLGWDGTTLHGYDEFFHAFIEIDTTTGEGSLIELVVLGNDPFSDATYHDGLYYINYYPYITSGIIHTFDPVTYEQTVAFDMVPGGGPQLGIAYGPSFAGRGFYVVTGSLLHVYLEPGYHDLRVGTTSVYDSPLELEWDASTATLYKYKGVPYNQRLYTLDTITGEQTEIASDITPQFRSIAIVVQSEETPLLCDFMDNNADGDIDLIDYATFQDCFTGPAQ